MVVATKKNACREGMVPEEPAAMKLTKKKEKAPMESRPGNVKTKKMYDKHVIFCARLPAYLYLLPFLFAGDKEGGSK